MLNPFWNEHGPRSITVICAFIGVALTWFELVGK